MTAQTRRVLLLPPMLRALDAWLADPSPSGAEVLTREIDGVARLLGLALTRLQVTASPLPDLAFAGADAADGIDHELRSPTGDEVIGVARLAGDADHRHTRKRAFTANPVLTSATQPPEYT